MSEEHDYVFVRRQTAVQSGIGKADLVYTGKYEIVMSYKGWGQLGKVIGECDDVTTALNMCMLVNGKRGTDYVETVEEWNWKG